MPPATPTPTPTFRDPAGSLTLTGIVAVRTVHADARDAVLRFLDSPLRRDLEQRGLMVATTVASAAAGPLQLHHPQVPIVTYPWEWTPGQWLAAAQLTLGLCEEALGHGWLLKDATPLNIVFVGAKPVLVDVLSFVEHRSGDPIWLAYGQYVRAFLLPMVMLRLLHWPLALTLLRRDGYEPAELYAALSWTQRLSPAAFVPVTLPTWFAARKPAATPAATGLKEPDLALHLLHGTLRRLRRRTRKALPATAHSSWSDYTTALGHYTAEQRAQKLGFVRETLHSLRPARVLDVGANTGEFSVLAATLGASVVALERDAAAAESLHRRAVMQQLDVLAVNADLARPTPAVGWENGESTSLLARLEGRFDLVLMLAVVHHLLLMEQIPLPAIVGLLHRLATRHLLVEWVPATDPMYRSLLRGRDDLYGSLCEDDLLRACEGRFTVGRRLVLGNDRVLLLLQRLPDAGAA